ncbi:hypothetical protein QGX15_gp056 [Pseudomonas phage psageK4e]|uniref:Uncharacterized protein n=1 Tax=Pseudomonas phage psageK4e TaxID=2875723 RepID=A0AAE8XN00_9CAUD|nr:hypothetical protein QGX15_gp056 [Pseudomonas phage psageK4e]UAW53504.1 hypothetical protein psageK4e_056c [Pseudomonas phage psageK4e]
MLSQTYLSISFSILPDVCSHVKVLTTGKSVVLSRIIKSTRRTL